MAKIPLESISLDRRRRIRSILNEAKLVELQASMAKLGLINPITLDAEFQLVAGEHRLEAARRLGWTEIEYTQMPVSGPTRELVELEENTRRADMEWSDQARAIDRIFNLYKDLMPEEPDEAIYTRMGYKKSWVSQCRQVVAQLNTGNERVSAASGIKAASKVIEREIDKAIHAEADILDKIEEKKSFDEVRPAELDLLNKSFFDWASTYSGPLFNLIHCDFPYGINHNESAQGKALQYGAYEDSPETYNRLIECLLDNYSRFGSPNSHILFWLSMTRYSDTVAVFSSAGFFVNPFPIIWVKDRGIAPDTARRPRQVYEAALLMTKGDRPLIKPGRNVVQMSAEKEIHLSEKPEPMLCRLFEMLVDNTTRLLDPTAGSGTALRAAEFLGASAVFGLELDPRYHAKAVARLKYNRELIAKARKLV